MVVKRKLDGEVDESSADHEIRKSDVIVQNLGKNCTSGIRTYGRQTKFGRSLTF